MTIPSQPFTKQDENMSGRLAHLKIVNSILHSKKPSLTKFESQGTKN
jgi:hypothetical protein